MLCIHLTSSVLSTNAVFSGIGVIDKPLLFSPTLQKMQHSCELGSDVYV